MDNERFGAFIAQLRKEQGLTQRELADRLNVTDKAVSKWETAKGFPDVKLLEPLAQAIFAQEPDSPSPQKLAGPFVDPEKGVASIEEALQGAADIIAEMVSDSAALRKTLRNFLLMHAAAANVSGQIASVIAGGLIITLVTNAL